MGTSLPGHSLLRGVEWFVGPEHRVKVPEVHRYCWPSSGTRGHRAGSDRGRWRLVSPGRQRCLPLRSGLVNLNVNLVSKLITNAPCQARAASLLGSALRGLVRHLWSRCLVVSSCWLDPSRRGRTPLVSWCWWGPWAGVRVRAARSDEGCFLSSHYWGVCVWGKLRRDFYVDAAMCGAHNVI